MAGQAGRLIALGALAGIVLAASAPAATTGAQLRTQLKVLGPAEVEKSHFDDEIDGHDDGYAVVETGSSDGIAVAVALLRTVADGAISERLHSSLGTALQRHSERVLPFIGTSHVDAEVSCLPFLPAEELTTTQVLAQARLTQAALNRPTSRRFPRQRAACMKQVRDLIAHEKKRG